MLLHFCEEFPLVLVLVVLMLLVPADTSECERVFSLMNDLKTAERSKHTTDLMCMLPMCVTREVCEL